MKKLAILLAGSVIGTAAYAQTTVIQKEDGLSRTVVKERSVDDAAVVKEKKVITTGSTGCASKTVKKTDEFGDSKTKTKVEC
jgi:FlaA1/EpsC-like NDP-sugar epimerase